MAVARWRVFSKFREYSNLAGILKFDLFVPGGTILFYSSVVKLGALAIGETPPNEEISGEMTEDKMDQVSQR